MKCSQNKRFKPFDRFTDVLGVLIGLIDLVHLLQRPMFVEDIAG